MSLTWFDEDIDDESGIGVFPPSEDVLPVSMCGKEKSSVVLFGSGFCQMRRVSDECGVWGAGTLEDRVRPAGWGPPAAQQWACIRRPPISMINVMYG